MSNFKQEEEMSMEDILSSIRRYVSEDEGGKVNPYSQDSYPIVAEEPKSNKKKDTDDDVISLGQEDVADVTIDSDSVIIPNNVENDQQSVNVDTKKMHINQTHVSQTSENSFNKLAEALKSFGKQKKTNELSLNMTVEQFFRSVTESYLQKWMNANLKKIVDDAIRREIEQLKSE